MTTKHPLINSTNLLHPPVEFTYRDLTSIRIPYRNFAELIEYSKKKPGQVRIGHPGSGSVGDFCVQLINALTGAELVPVPYAGAAPAIAALRGEHIEGVMQAPKEIYCSRAAAAARASGTTS